MSAVTNEVGSITGVADAASGAIELASLKQVHSLLFPHRLEKKSDSKLRTAHVVTRASACSCTSSVCIRSIQLMVQRACASLLRHWPLRGTLASKF